MCVTPAAIPLAVSSVVISENPYFLRSSSDPSTLPMVVRHSAISSNGALSSPPFVASPPGIANALHQAGPTAGNRRASQGNKSALSQVGSVRATL